MLVCVAEDPQAAGEHLNLRHVGHGHGFRRHDLGRAGFETVEVRIAAWPWLGASLKIPLRGARVLAVSPFPCGGASIARMRARAAGEGYVEHR